MILKLSSNQVLKTADFIENYFGASYGSIAATLFENNPEKYLTKISIKNDNINGVLSYHSGINSVNIKLLAGDNKTIFDFINYLKQNYKLLKINVLFSMEKYINQLKENGFKVEEEINPNNYCEGLVKLIN